jgi:hypothetical protein
MKKKLAAAALLLALPLGAAAAMDVATFIAKADALERKGVMAVFSGDYKALKGEIEVSAAQLRAERLAAKKAGRPQAYCPPPKSDVTPREILAHFRAIPAAQRGRMQVKDGLRGLLARKYPCRR